MTRPYTSRKQIFTVTFIENVTSQRRPEPGTLVIFGSALIAWAATVDLAMVVRSWERATLFPFEPH